MVSCKLASSIIAVSEQNKKKDIVKHTKYCSLVIYHGFDLSTEMPKASEEKLRKKKSTNAS